MRIYLTGSLSVGAVAIGFLWIAFLTLAIRSEEIHTLDSYDPSISFDMDVLLDAIQKVENPSKNRNLIGDRHLTNMAYGIYQIRQPLLDDINNTIVGADKLQKLWGSSCLTTNDMRKDGLARWCARSYLIHYGRAYQRQTGYLPSSATYIRIYNGGPDGWKKNSTIPYMHKVFNQLGYSN